MPSAARLPRAGVHFRQFSSSTETRCALPEGVRRTAPGANRRRSSNEATKAPRESVRLINRLSIDWQRIYWFYPSNVRPLNQRIWRSRLPLSADDNPNERAARERVFAGCPVSTDEAYVVGAAANRLLYIKRMDRKLGASQNPRLTVRCCFSFT